MGDQMLTLARINQERGKLNRLNDGKQIRDDEGACRFINERGFVLLMPIEGIPLPSLSKADAAAPWHGFAITDRAWAWKETLPEQKLCAYTKLIHGRGTFISWRLYPSFLKVYGPEGDLDYEYANGRLERAARDLCKIVADYGPINSRELWIKAKDVFGGKRTRFTAALEHLQSRFLLTVSGGSLEGWTLHTWDLVERQVPGEILAKLPSPEEARVNILRQAIQNCVAAPAPKFRSILRWNPADLERSVELLKQEGAIQEIAVEGQKLPWLINSDFRKLMAYI
jgi:hypothetical protein